MKCTRTNYRNLDEFCIEWCNYSRYSRLFNSFGFGTRVWKHFNVLKSNSMWKKLILWISSWKKSKLKRHSIFDRYPLGNTFSPSNFDTLVVYFFICSSMWTMYKVFHVMEFRRHWFFCRVKILKYYFAVRLLMRQSKD